MNKKLLLTAIFLLSFGNLNTFADYLYVTENDTKVFLDLNQSYKYIFWEGYKVKDSGKETNNFQKVYLTDGQTAFINSSSLSPDIDDIYFLNSNSAEVLPEEFPIFIEPNPKGNIITNVHRGDKLEILNSNLINKVWVRVKNSSGDTGYIWYKALHFSNNSDNGKQTTLLGGLEDKIENNSNIDDFDFFDILNENSNNIDIDYQISRVKNNDYYSYMIFLERIDNLQYSDPKNYNGVIYVLKQKSPSTYDDLISLSSEETFTNNDYIDFESINNESINDESIDFEDDFMDLFQIDLNSANENLNENNSDNNQSTKNNTPPSDSDSDTPPTPPSDSDSDTPPTPPSDSDGDTPPTPPSDNSTNNNSSSNEELDEELDGFLKSFFGN